MEVTSYLLGKNAGGGGVTPTGTISITENGEHDVTNYAIANVNVSGGAPEYLDELNDYVEAYFNNLLNMPDSYETLYNVEKTLYTPNVNFTHYMIFKNKNEKYRIGWFGTNNNINAGIRYKNKALQYMYIVTNGGGIVLPYFSYYEGTGQTWKRFSNNEYNTLDEAIADIQNSQVVYKSDSDTFSTQAYDENSIYYSNSYIINLDTDTYIIPKKLSSNEIIQPLN